ncbi:MAG: hypothetical protein ACI8RD_010459 [Bacillariaceae sp.]|jgi:hypothetical protein
MPPNKQTAITSKITPRQTKQNLLLTVFLLPHRTKNTHQQSVCTSKSKTFVHFELINSATTNVTTNKSIIMSEDAGAGSDDFSGLGGFFFYVFLVHPITAWILRPGRFERKKSIMYAIAFLAALAAVKTGE